MKESSAGRGIQLVLPMAGLGSRFSLAGYETPKPLLSIHGTPMYKVVLDNLLHPQIVSVTIVCPRTWELPKKLSAADATSPVEFNFVEIDYLPQGPAKSVYLASDFLNPDLPVVIANSDQYLDADLTDFYSSITNAGASGTILCMEDSDPKWSYVKTTPAGLVSAVREKEVISNLATVGLYGFSKASLMLAGFDDMFAANDTFNGEFYVAPAYNYLIKKQMKVTAINIGPIGEVMHGLGIPSDFEAFLSNPLSRRLGTR
jgi:dTDP-glucose pyrophosphorylase